MISTARMLLALALLRVADWVAGDGALLPKAEPAPKPESDDDWHPVVGALGRVTGRARLVASLGELAQSSRSPRSASRRAPRSPSIPSPGALDPPT